MPIVASGKSPGPGSLIVGSLSDYDDDQNVNFKKQ